MEENQQERSTDDLSEEASPYRLEEYRKKGQVAQSRELTATVALIATGIGIFALAPSFTSDILKLMKEQFSGDVLFKLKTDNGSFILAALIEISKKVLKLSLPIGILSFIVALAGSYAQIGAVFSTTPLTPDFERINPVKGIQRYFSIKMVLDGLRLVLRAGIVLTVAYFIIKSWVWNVPVTAYTAPERLGIAFGSAGKSIFFTLSAILLVFSGFDFWLQRWEFSKQVRLTKQEAKQEHKEHEGDPLIKARIRSVQKEVARRRMMDAVKTADVVVTNPTHIAVAIQYDREKMDAPKVVAKGADFIAQKIKKIAADAGIPRIENVALARTLYKQVKIGRSIPRTLYQAVAEILAFVYKLKNRKF